METSKHIDRERRRMKLKTRKSWLKSLIVPKTVTCLIILGRLITYVVWVYLMIIKILRE